MKLPVLLCLIAGCVVPALAQRPGEMRNSLGATTVDRVAIGADDAGREALCEQIRLMSTRARDVRILPEGVELLCDGSDATTFALRFQTAPALTEKLICDLVDKPSSLVFYQMRPIALRAVRR
jgi:hypothetical protein